MKSKFLSYFAQISLVLIISFIYLKTISNNFDFEIDLAGNNNNFKYSLFFIISSIVFILIAHIFKFSLLKSMFFTFWEIVLILAIFTLLRGIFPAFFYSKIAYIIFSLPILFSIPLVILPLSGFALFSNAIINYFIFIIIPLLFSLPSIINRIKLKFKTT